MTHRGNSYRRADLVLCERGLVATRSRAQDLIRRGQVLVNGKVVDRPGALVPVDADLALRKGRLFVSRGGEKLDAALDELGTDLRGAVVADIGASTGGFTDCVLRRGARKVYAVDVGHDQLDPSLRADDRVVVWEGKNARDLVRGDFEEPVDAVVVDASFISIDKLAPAFARILPEGGRLVALVKPQFEAGPEVARRTRGVVRNRDDRARAIARARAAIEQAGFRIVGECDSRVPGPKGNVERFIAAVRVGGRSSEAGEA